MSTRHSCEIDTRIGFAKGKFRSGRLAGPREIARYRRQGIEYNLRDPTPADSSRESFLRLLRGISILGCQIIIKDWKAAARQVIYPLLLIPRLHPGHLPSK